MQDEKRKIAQMASYLNQTVYWGEKKKALHGVQPGFLTSCVAGNVFIQYNCHRSTSLKWMPLQSKLKSGTCQGLYHNEVNQTSQIIIF